MTNAKTEKPIHKFSLGHGLLRSYVDYYILTFYRKVEVTGLENIPKNTPVVFAINHQNALMDALTVLCTMKGQPVFMARSDIFKNPFAAKILRFFKILPIYRIRDGIRNLQNNDAVFEQAVAVLQDKQKLCILPEGSHFGQKRLRELKKGLARIAFMAEYRNNFELGTQIVPVGIDYSNYINFGSRLLIQFGKPFAVANFKDDYNQNEQKAMALLMQEISEKMKPLMLNINDPENYNSIYTIATFYTNHLKFNAKQKIKHIDEVKIKQQLSNTIINLKNTNIDLFNNITKKALEVKNTIKQLNFRDWVISNKHYSTTPIIINLIALLALFPVFVIGLLLNFIPFYLPVYFSRNVKDPQFLSSFRFVFSIITFTIFGIIYLILSLIIIKPLWLSLIVFASFPFWGIAGYYYYRCLKKTIAKLRNNYMLQSKNKTWQQMHNDYNFIIDNLLKLQTADE